MLLSLKGNRLPRIPFGIRRLRSLRTLNLADNQLKSLPNIISRMTFDTLDLSGSEMFTEPLNAHDLLRMLMTEDIQRQPLNLWQIAANIVIMKKYVQIEFKIVKCIFILEPTQNAIYFQSSLWSI